MKGYNFPMKKLFVLVLIVLSSQILHRSVSAADVEEKSKEPKQQALGVGIVKEDYFQIAQAISNKPGGRKLVLKNIMRDHTGDNPHRSYFYARTEEEINNIIDEVVMSPSYCDISKSSGRLMIIKDFKENIGVHITPQEKGIESCRVTLFFCNLEEVIGGGKPWKGSLGILLTGYPDNPARPYL